MDGVAAMLPRSRRCSFFRQDAPGRSGTLAICTRRERTPHAAIPITS